jgi:hypothetical protein
MLSLILLVFALVLFILAGAIRFTATDEPWRGRIVCWGLACAVGAALNAFWPVLKGSH